MCLGSGCLGEESVKRRSKLLSSSSVGSGSGEGQGGGTTSRAGGNWRRTGNNGTEMLRVSWACCSRFCQGGRSSWGVVCFSNGGQWFWYCHSGTYCQQTTNLYCRDDEGT